MPEQTQELVAVVMVDERSFHLNASMKMKLA